MIVLNVQTSLPVEAFSPSRIPPVGTVRRELADETVAPAACRLFSGSPFGYSHEPTGLAVDQAGIRA